MTYCLSFVVSVWAGVFLLTLGMVTGGALLALLSRQTWKLASAGDAGCACLTSALWSLGNYGMLLLVGVTGAGRGFTISQLSVVVSALIGICWLHEPEPRTRAARLIFTVACWRRWEVSCRVISGESRLNNSGVKWILRYGNMRWNHGSSYDAG